MQMSDDANVDAALRRLQNHPGVVGYLILNENGIILKQYNVKPKEAVQMAGLIHHLAWDTIDFIRKAPYPEGGASSSSASSSAQHGDSALGSAGLLPTHHVGLQNAIQSVMASDNSSNPNNASDDQLLCIRLHTYKREFIVCPAYSYDEENKVVVTGQQQPQQQIQQQQQQRDELGRGEGAQSGNAMNSNNQHEVRYTLIVVQQTPLGQKLSQEEKAAAERTASAPGASTGTEGDDGN